MKKKIAILGSTGSIGVSLLNIIKKDKNNFEVLLLTANKNYKKLFKQAKVFNVKNLIITDKKSFKAAKNKIKKNKINIYNNFDNFNQIFTKKIDYVMSSIVGINGLLPTIEIIKYTKKIVIANKESIICAWNLIQKELNKYKTEFIPVDSEHFSIWYALKNIQISKVKKIYLTASGGPLLNIPLNKFKNLKISQILKHPSWKMGKKITVDSSTMMNKVFEIIEAKKIFNISYSKLNILIHPQSYLHAIIKFNNGLIKIIAHDTTMEIPIFNTIYDETNYEIKSKDLDIKKLNNLDLMKVENKRFPLVKILNKLPNNNSLFETAVVSANDELVDLYLKKQIKYKRIGEILLKITNKKEILNLKKISPNKIFSIIKINEYVRLKIKAMVYNI